MKNLLMMLLLASTAYSQPAEFDIVFAIGLDPKMAIEGAHKGREGNQPSLDYEVSFGFEWENTRLLMKAKNHEAINFFKWTYLAFDYKREVIKNVYGYAGLEMSQIRRYHPDFSGSNPDNYREVTINPLQFGANLELQYKLMNDRFGIALQFSFYQSEDELKPIKKHRKDVTLAAFFYL